MKNKKKKKDHLAPGSSSPSQRSQAKTAAASAVGIRPPSQCLQLAGTGRDRGGGSGVTLHFQLADLPGHSASKEGGS